MTPELAAKILARRKAGNGNAEALIARILEHCFDKQREFILDPAKLKALFCTRRAAKSYTAGSYHILEGVKTPKCNNLFIGLTRESARDIVWKDVLKELDETFKLGAVFNETNLTMTLRNGSVIKVTGADADEKEMNKLLGRKYRLVTLDEGSLYTIDLQRLIYGILKPAITDMDGTICMMGTASNFTRGLFFDVTRRTEAGWKLFEWSAHDNPHVAKRWQEELDEIDTMRPLFKETPLYKQWYLNQWVVDDSKLVYKFNEARNLYQQLPTNLNPELWSYVLGVDTGWEDDNAFVLCAFHANDPTLYILETFNRPHMTFDQVVDKIREFISNDAYSIGKVIIDGANKQGVESMRQRSSIPFEYADKVGKVDFIEMLNGDLVQGKIKINAHCHALVDELMGLVWKTDGDKIVIPKKEHPSLPNHLCDAFLYAWRNGYHYHSEPVKEPVVVGSRQWYLDQSNNMWEREREALQNQNEGDWPVIGPGFSDY